MVYNKNMEKRLDIYLAESFNLQSRNKAQTLIKKGNVLVNGKVSTKVGESISENDTVEIIDLDDYVSRGAYKLVKAIEVFGIDFTGKVVLDMGASTGGFTQVCLESGAKKVYAVDVGKGELNSLLATDRRVVNMEGTDVRNLTIKEVGGVEIVVGDLSFISLKHILPKINSLFGKVECALLFKPQFECGKVLAKKSRGVIKDRKIHKELLKEFLDELNLYSYRLSGLTSSPIKGKEGNIEYLLHINGQYELRVDVDKIVEDAFAEFK